jgi:hypothetical protein
MSRLIHVLYPVPDLRRTAFSLLRWWESRRPFYNLVVGGTGLITLSGMFVLSGGQFDVFSRAALTPVLAYAVAANACYSFGWTVEVLARFIWGDEAPRMGPLLFRQGLIFSVGVTLLPLLAAFLYTALRLVKLVLM